LNANRDSPAEGERTSTGTQGEEEKLIPRGAAGSEPKFSTQTDKTLKKKKKGKKEKGSENRTG